jgi:hypothetical protein
VSKVNQLCIDNTRIFLDRRNFLWKFPGTQGRFRNGCV